MKKEGDSIQVFFNKIKTLSDTLTSIGRPLRPEEFIGYVTDGLDEDYDALIETFLERTDLIPTGELFSRLQST
jgi:hypothetical protein